MEVPPKVQLELKAKVLDHGNQANYLLSVFYNEVELSQVSVLCHFIVKELAYFLPLRYFYIFPY